MFLYSNLFHRNKGLDHGVVTPTTAKALGESVGPFRLSNCPLAPGLPDCLAMREFPPVESNKPFCVQFDERS